MQNLEDTLGAFLLFLHNNCVLKMLTPGIKDRCRLLIKLPWYEKLIDEGNSEKIVEKVETKDQVRS